MPNLSNHQSNDFTKMILMGDSSSGKTGSLVSLVEVGYKLRIWDYDNGLESLKAQVEKRCPNKIDNVSFRTLRDKRRTVPNGSVAVDPKAFERGLAMLDRWRFKESDGTEVDLGSPHEWGEDCVAVFDSMTMMSEAAYDWADPLVPMGKGGKDGRAVYGLAQDALWGFLQVITSDYFGTNVILICHVSYIDNEIGRKGYPTTIGQKLSPRVPILFNSIALCQTVAGKRTIQTEATALIDLKNPKPFEMKPHYSLSTGLAEFFGTLKGKEKPPVDLNRLQSIKAIKRI